MTNPKMLQIGPEGSDHWLDDDIPLWRYVPLKNLFSYLSGCLFIPSIQKLRASEPFEGEFLLEDLDFNGAMHDRFGNLHETVTKEIHKRLPKDTQHLIKLNKDLNHGEYAFKEYQKWYLEFLKRTRFAWCWYVAGKESAAMWSTYGLHGAAVVSTVGKIKKLLVKHKCSGAYRQMHYYANGWFNPETESGKELILRPFFLKRDEYKSEEEVRFVIVDTTKSWRRGNSMLLYGVKPSDWIQRVILGPGLTKQQVSALKRAIWNFSKKINCDDSKLHYGSQQELEDRLEELERIPKKGIADGLPKCLKEV